MSSDFRTGLAPGPSPELSNVELTTARYLFAVSTLSTDTEERIATGELKKYLGVTPASVTEMMAKLDERGLVDYKKYQGVCLTERGEGVTSRISWRLCVVTSFFDSVLETNLDEETAFDIGFTLPEDGVYRLRERMESSCLEVCPESGRREARCLA